MITILIADDHTIFADALSALLGDTAGIDVVATVVDGVEALRMIEEIPGIDLLILDVVMPNMDGIAVLGELRRRHSDVKVLVLTQELDSGTIVRAMKAGASGYLLKSAGREQFLDAIRTVASGGEYLGDDVKETLVARATGRKSEKSSPHLTRRESEILKLIASGQTSRQIADRLFISLLTVETHRRNILQKLELRNVAGLVRYAIEHGMTDA